MQHRDITKARVCLFSGLLFSGLLFSGLAQASSTLGSQTISLSTTPTQLACSGTHYVNHLTIRVLPGYAGKVYVGTSAMTTSAPYNGLIAVLYPNGGAHSEEFTITSGNQDNINLCDFYTEGAIAGEDAIAEYSYNTGTNNGFILEPIFTGGISGSYLCNKLVGGSHTFPVACDNSTWSFTTMRAQMIPGYSGKESVQYVSSCRNSPATCTLPFSGEVADLYPNSGTLSQHSAWSEVYQISDPFYSNGLAIGETNKYPTNTANPWVTDFYFVPAVSGEYTLVSLWSLVEGWTASASPGSLTYETPSSAPSWNIQGGPISTASGTNSTGPSGVSTAYSVQARVVPGYGSKVYINDCNGHNHRILYPNNTGSLGWSEDFTFGPGAMWFTHSGANTVCFTSDSASEAEISFLTPSATYTVPTGIPFYNITGQNATSITPASGGTSIGLGNVSKLTVSVTPGQTGKMYIGSSSMNTSTLAGVYAILYPNSSGRWSETLELFDPEGDGIPSSNLYIKSQVSGEYVEVSSMTTGVTPYDGVLSVKQGGPLSGSGDSYGVAFSSTSTPSAFLRTQAIPGGEGKLWVGTSSMTAAQPDSSYANVLKVLWPSEGNYNVGEGHSERFIQSCFTSNGDAYNCLDLQNYKFWPYISSEQLLVFALGR